MSQRKKFHCGAARSTVYYQNVEVGMILKTSDVCQKMTQEEGGLLEFMAVFGGKIRFSDTKFEREFRIMYRTMYVRSLILYYILLHVFEQHDISDELLCDLGFPQCSSLFPQGNSDLHQ